MRTIRTAAFMGALLCASNAWADTFTIERGDYDPVDPSANFEEDCLGETEAEDCPERAAALHAELVELLGSLGSRNDPETVALFEAVSEMEDPRLQQVALRYFSYVTEPPSGLWEKARAFFFGPDPSVGHPSAELLGKSMEDLDQELSRLYLAGRPSYTYGGEFPSGMGIEDSWAESRARDVLLDAVDSFPESDRFPEASRLLMLDRFVTDPFWGDSLGQTPVTGFVTEAPLSDVEEHFTSVFGAAPHPSPEQSFVAQQELVQELLELQQRIMSGDFSVGERIEEVGFELQAAQEAALLGTRLGLEAIEATDHVFWIEGSPDSLSDAPLGRAVAVAIDPRLDLPVIRYFAAQTGATAEPGGGEGGADGGGSAGEGQSGGRSGTGNRGGRPGNGDASAGEGATDGEDGDGSKDDSGCGCALPGSSSGSSALWLLAPLAWALRRRRGR